MEVAHLSDGRDEILRFERIVKNEFAACDAAIDVVCGSRNEEARVSWHEISPMRGRDEPDLTSHPQNATMRNVAPIGTHQWRPSAAVKVRTLPAPIAKKFSP